MPLAAYGPRRNERPHKGLLVEQRPEQQMSFKLSPALMTSRPRSIADIIYD